MIDFNVEIDQKSQFLSLFAKCIISEIVTDATFCGILDFLNAKAS